MPDDEDRVLMLWRYRFAARKMGLEASGGIVGEGDTVFVGRGADPVGEPSGPEEAGRVERVPLSGIPGLTARAIPWDPARSSVSCTCSRTCLHTPAELTVEGILQDLAG